MPRSKLVKSSSPVSRRKRPPKKVQKMERMLSSQPKRIKRKRKTQRQRTKLPQLKKRPMPPKILTLKLPKALTRLTRRMRMPQRKREMMLKAAKKPQVVVS